MPPGFCLKIGYALACVLFVTTMIFERTVDPFNKKVIIMYNMETKYESAMERNAYDPYSKATEKS